MDDDDYEQRLLNSRTWGKVLAEKYDPLCFKKRKRGDIYSDLYKPYKPKIAKKCKS